MVEEDGRRQNLCCPNRLALGSAVAVAVAVSMAMANSMLILKRNLSATVASSHQVNQISVLNLREKEYMVIVVKGSFIGTYL